MVKDIFSFETVNNQVVTVFKASPDLRLELDDKKLDGIISDGIKFLNA